MSEKSKIQRIQQENQAIRHRIQQFRSQNSSQSNLRSEITRFIQESKRNLTEMNSKIQQENSLQNQKLHHLTTNYQALLKKQIELLTENKHLTEKKQKQDQLFNENIEKITAEYEGQIKEFQEKVKLNVKKIQDLSGSNIINRLLKNHRFRQTMHERGCSLQSLEKQSQLQDVSVAVQEKEKEIAEAEERSAQLDEELGKMHQLIDTMKQLMENMMKEKENILKQNVILKEKLAQSEELISRLLGNAVPEGEEGEEGEEIEEDEEDIEEQPDQSAPLK